MPETPGDARITELPDGLIPALAELYDKFAHSLEPFSEERDIAEQTFVTEVVKWWDLLADPKPSLQDFRKGVILRCRRHLAARDKPDDKQFLWKLDNAKSDDPNH
jgi:hypothetical protein